MNKPKQKRKKIIFRVIGGGKYGLGHLYRSLELAQMIAGHEVCFICSPETKPAAERLLGSLYRLVVCRSNFLEAKIISLRPELVVNDTLDTDKKYIKYLKNHGIKVVNFEDLGSGATLADLTINELYDMPVITGRDILWGHEYYFVRDEFRRARARSFQKKVGRLLITFGGADPNDFTRKVLKIVMPLCRENQIRIVIVTGPGYRYIDKLGKELLTIKDVDVEYTHAAGVMSSIMERSDIAITSNGRTVYELAHMNIPAIILSHHQRENTHVFAKEENGFIPIGTYDGREKKKKLSMALQRLVQDVDYRRSLFNKMSHFRFNNKNKVKKLILNILER